MPAADYQSLIDTLTGAGLIARPAPGFALIPPTVAKSALPFGDI